MGRFQYGRFRKQSAQLSPVLGNTGALSELARDLPLGESRGRATAARVQDLRAGFCRGGVAVGGGGEEAIVWTVYSRFSTGLG